MFLIQVFDHLTKIYQLINVSFKVLVILYFNQSGQSIDPGIRCSQLINQSTEVHRFTHCHI